MDEDWISITEAANRLTASGDKVDRSTLSRYLKQHAEALPLKPDGKSNLVEFGALVAHRSENIRIRTMLPLPTTGAAVSPAMSPAASRFVGTQADGAARKVNADAEMREMELARRKRQLTIVSEVDKAGRDAVALMMSAFERAIEPEAATTALKNGWDERRVRVALKAFMKSGLDVFHREVLNRLDEMRRSDEEDDEPAVSTE